MHNDSKIKIENSKQVNKLIIEYLKNEESIKPFYTYENSLKGFKEKIKDRSLSSSKRQLLVNRIKAQYQSYNLSVPENLNELLKENTFTVTTGHQLGLFGGPKYFIHKIVSTLKLSEMLSAEFPEYNFVPVFWLASEDHDFEEVSKANLFNKTIEAHTELKGAVGRMPASIYTKAYCELYSFLSNEDEKLRLKELFNENTPSSTLSEETTRWVNHLFSHTNLIIVDADDKELKKEFTSTMRSELLNKKAFTSITETNQQLKNKGYKTQVNPREINLFYLDNNLRERIVEEDTKFKVLNTDIIFSKEEILQELTENPQKFSPNVILRPLYQETILPNLAYIGGPGEISYWLQLKEMFKNYNTQFPILVLRDLYMIIPPSILRQIEKLNLSIEDFFLDEKTLLEQYIQKNNINQLDIKEQLSHLQQIKKEIIQQVQTIDTPSVNAVEIAFHKFNKELEKIEKKVLKNTKKKEETNLNKITKIKQRLIPNGKLAERSECFIPDYLSMKEQYPEKLMQRSNPFITEIKVLKQ